MNLNEETLMAYADGELDTAERARIAALIDADPSLAARVEAHRTLRAQIGAAYDGALDEPTPEALVRLIAGAAPPSAEVVDLAPLRRSRNPLSRTGWAQWGAMAACFVLGVLVAAPLQLGSSDLVRTRGLKLIAHGQLSRALTTRLASDPQNATAPVRIGLSFLSKHGRYCRTFTAAGRGELAGVACRDDGRWRVMTAVYANTGPGAQAYRPAGSQTPQAVMDVVEADIAGAPLDARAEATARAGGWRSPSGLR